MKTEGDPKKVYIIDSAKVAKVFGEMSVEIDPEIDVIVYDDIGDVRNFIEVVEEEKTPINPPFIITDTRFEGGGVLSKDEVAKIGDLVKSHQIGGAVFTVMDPEDVLSVFEHRLPPNVAVIEKFGTSRDKLKDIIRNILASNQ